MASTVDQIKEKLSIVDVVSSYVKLERAGANMRARCPFHNERTPSFMVSPDRGTYHCFGCGVGGDMFTFVQEIEGIDFKGALKILADKAGVQIVYEKSSEKTEKGDRLYALLETAALFYQKGLAEESPAYGYLTERGLIRETVNSFRIGWAPDGWQGVTDFLREKKFTDAEIEAAGLAKKGERGLYDRFRSRIMFPIADTTGRIVGFSGRIFSEKKSDDDAPKYINSPETALFQKSKILYGYDRAKQSMRRLDFVLLVEGQMDLVMSHQAGWTNTVAVSGTALTEEHIVLLKRQTRNIVVALDADSAGIKAATKSARIALMGGMEVKVAALPKDTDPADLIKAEGKDAWSACIRESVHIISFLLRALRENSKDDRAFQRAVEEFVLPFVRDVEHPIDREQFVREVASALGASEVAVNETIARLPAETPAQSTQTPTVTDEPAAAVSLSGVSPRLMQLWGVILWQRSLTTPIESIGHIEEQLETHLGSSLLDELRGMDEKKREQLRFGAEQLYAEVKNIEKEMEHLVIYVLKEHYQKELQDASAGLKRAEHGGSETEMKRALEHLKKCTDALAKIERMG